MSLFAKDEDRTEQDINETILLISRLNTRDIRVTSGIRKALIKKGERAIEGLTRSLNSPNGMVREACVEMLGEIASPRATPALISMLYDYREDIPLKSERAIRKVVETHLTKYDLLTESSEEYNLDRRRIVDPLVAALSSPSELMRMGEVVRLLIDLKNEATRSLLKIYADTGYATREFIKREIMKIPESKKLELIPFAGSFKHKEVQRLVISILNSLSDRANLRQMIENLIESGNCSLELKVFCRLKGLIKQMIEEMKALKSDIRWRALSYLENFTTEEEVVAAIRLRLKDPEKRIRQRALLILGNLEEGYSSEPLILALDDADEDVQICALRMLVRRNYPDIISLLVKMSMRSKNMRAIALAELAQISPHDYASLMEKMSPQMREELSQKLVEFNLDILNSLKEELQKLDAEQRLKAARAIQVIGLPVDVDEEYVASLSDPDERVRATLVKTVGVAGNTMAMQAILRSLNDPDRRVRANAIETYSDMRDPELLKRLAVFLRDPDNRVRGNVIKVLLGFGYEPAYGALIEMLNSDQELLRLSGLWVVSELKETRAKDIVAKLSLTDKSKTVQQKAIATLRALGIELRL